jgi:hypothetical protein
LNGTVDQGFQQVLFIGPCKRTGRYMPTQALGCRGATFTIWTAVAFGPIADEYWLIQDRQMLDFHPVILPVKLLGSLGTSVASTICGGMESTLCPHRCWLPRRPPKNQLLNPPSTFPTARPQQRTLDCNRPSAWGLPFDAHDLYIGQIQWNTNVGHFPTLPVMATSPIRADSARFGGIMHLTSGKKEKVLVHL